MAHQDARLKRRIWYFDSPVYTDPLFILSVALGIGFLVWALVVAGHSASVRVYQAVAAFPSAFGMVALVLGTLRGFIRGYSEKPE